jgi:CO/xanthine dehydrogenase FAD-binding subunit
MRGDSRAFEVVRPRRLAEALAALAEPDRPMPLAGGTDLFVLLNDGRAPARRYLDLTLLDELRGIESSAAGLRLGARTTYTELRRSREILRRAPILAEMAATIGAVAIQNRGTLGGSLGNASPASDPAAVLLALDAGVELARREGRRIERRTLSLADFFTGYRATAARADELVTAVSIPASALSGWRYAYRKVAARRAQAISKVVAAVGVSSPARSARSARSDRPDRESSARIAFGSVAATTVRARAAEEVLAGRRLDAATAAEACAALVAHDIRPIDDLRSSAEYRTLVAGRILVTLLADLGGFSAADLLAG